MLWIITALIISYLIGSVPTAYIFGRVLKGADIRKFGSGNVGATNAMRLLGIKAGITVLILDILKGFVVVYVLGGLLENKTTLLSRELILILLGVTAICGHNWTVFLNFKGGKGIATTFGVLIGLAFNIPGLNLVLGLVILSWIISFVISRIVSLSSVIAAVALPVYLVVFKQSRLIFITGIILSVFVILRHKSNLVRLFKGEEKRLNFSNKSR
ncbi:MAG: glycerol-3-phosphate 1-O-acyltransferase PlsY [Candidatus Omnitrophica bacterium]|nr:glycerol-3-phosphate 1-O-acyltransferase PlsY [Candidatus Omnitrophota bacterium]